jgi:hypothetical protein
VLDKVPALAKDKCDKPAAESPAPDAGAGAGAGAGVTGAAAAVGVDLGAGGVAALRLPRTEMVAPM